MRGLFQSPLIRKEKASLVRRASESQNYCPCCCGSYGVCFNSQISQPGCCGRNSDSPSLQWSVRGSGVTSFLLSPAVCCQSALLCTSSQSCWLWVLSFFRLSTTNKLCGRPQANWKRWSFTLTVLSSEALGERDTPTDLILGQRLWFPIFYEQQNTQILLCFSKDIRDCCYQVWGWKCQTSLPRNSWKDHQHSAARKPVPIFHYSIPASYAASGCY